MNKKLGVALFGLGRIGVIHLRNIVVDSRLTLYFVLDENVEEAKTRASSIGGIGNEVKIISSDSATSVFTDERIDAVFICTPTYTHCQLVKTAVEHGKHVFCEKPISNNQKEIAELYGLALKRNVLLFCSFNRRFDPALSKMYEKFQSKAVGRVLTVKTCSRDHPLPETSYLSTSNGIFHDCAVHDIDIVCWIYGQLPISVYVAGSSSLEVIRNMGDVDSAIIVLKFPEDGLACIDISRISNYGYDQRVEVHGLEGMLVSENQFEHGMACYGPQGIKNELLFHSFNDRYRMSYVNAIDHFVSVAQGFPEGKKQLSVKGRDVLASCLIAEACKKSLSEGSPVNLTWDNIDEP